MDQYGKGTLHFPLELEHGKPTTQPMLTECCTAHDCPSHCNFPHLQRQNPTLLAAHSYSTTARTPLDTATSCVPRRETYRVQPESHSS